MRSQGLAIVFAEQPVDHPVGARRFRSFWNRHLRWFIYRRQYAWPSYILETAGGALVATIVGAIGWYALYGVSPAIFVPVGVAAWFAVEAIYLTCRKGPSQLEDAVGQSCARGRDPGDLVGVAVAVEPDLEIPMIGSYNPPSAAELFFGTDA